MNNDLEASTIKHRLSHFSSLPIPEVEAQLSEEKVTGNKINQEELKLGRVGNDYSSGEPGKVIQTTPGCIAQKKLVEFKFPLGPHGVKVLLMAASDMSVHLCKWQKERNEKLRKESRETGHLDRKRRPYLVMVSFFIVYFIFLQFAQENIDLLPLFSRYNVAVQALNLTLSFSFCC